MTIEGVQSPSIVISIDQKWTWIVSEKRAVPFMIKYCISLISKSKVMITLYLLVVILSIGINILSPFIYSKIIDILVEGTEVKKLLNMIIIFLVFFALSTVISYISDRLYTKIQSSVTFELNSQLLKHLQDASILETSKLDSEYLVQVITEDSNFLTMFGFSIINNFVANAITLMIFWGIAFVLNREIGFFLVALSVLHYIIYVVLKPHSFKYTHINKEKKAHYFSKLYRQLDMLKFIKQQSLQKKYLKELSSSFESLYSNILQVQKFFFLYSGANNAISIIATVIILFLGGLFSMQGKITIGLLFAVLSQFNASLQIITSLSDFGQEYQKALVSYTRILKLQKIEKQYNGSLASEKVESITINNLSFAFHNKTIFSEWSYIFTHGKLYGICGDNGVGKSTLIDILTGLYVGMYEGEVFYNNIEMIEMDMIEMRKNEISIMSQTISLISGTIESNISFSSRYSKKIYIQVERALGLESLYNNFPDGINTIINPTESNLSGGQKQLISLTRQLAKEASIYIFDEPTSHLDKGLSIMFMNYLQKIKLDAIVIIISHDYNVLRHCDEIIELDLISEKQQYEPEQ